MIYFKLYHEYYQKDHFCPEHFHGFDGPSFLLWQTFVYRQNWLVMVSLGISMLIARNRASAPQVLARRNGPRVQVAEFRFIRYRCSARGKHFQLRLLLRSCAQQLAHEFVKERYPVIALWPDTLHRPLNAIKSRDAGATPRHTRSWSACPVPGDYRWCLAVYSNRAHSLKSMARNQLRFGFKRCAALLVTKQKVMKGVCISQRLGTQRNLTISFAGDEADDNELNTKVSNPTNARQVCNEDVEVIGVSDSGNDADIYDSVLEMPFTPISKLSWWSNFRKSDEKLDWVNIAVFLPAGVAYTNVSYGVAGEGSMFELCVDWPNEIIGIDLMHRRWLKPEEEQPKKGRNDPEITGFLNFGNMLV